MSKVQLEVSPIHARRRQTKEGTYRIKEQLLPDVRDWQDVRDVATAAESDTVNLTFKPGMAIKNMDA